MKSFAWGLLVGWVVMLILQASWVGGMREQMDLLQTHLDAAQLEIGVLGHVLSKSLQKLPAFAAAGSDSRSDRRHEKFAKPMFRWQRH